MYVTEMVIEFDHNLGMTGKVSTKVTFKILPKCGLECKYNSSKLLTFLACRLCTFTPKAVVVNTFYLLAESLKI
ncbi:MAG: hypothetical protein EA343_18735 [Nodularia sp. (in: Bacteria)]|nr:MAG: hypothetical protein EA343_18735 [Nodularia sp. (in: cyanobacteria)]